MKKSNYMRYIAECIGTFFLILIGAGCVVFSGNQLGVLGVSLAFGLTLMVLISCLGPISGAHLNPAVTLTLAYTGKLDKKYIFGYILSQIIGSIMAGLLLYLIASGKGDFRLENGFALNGYGAHSPAGYGMLSCFFIEMIGTAFLCYVVLATIWFKFPSSFQSLIIGSTLSVLLFISIPLTNGSLNLARSIGVAVIYGNWAIQQLWLFVVAHFCAVMVCISLTTVTFPDSSKKDE